MAKTEGQGGGGRAGRSRVGSATDTSNKSETPQTARAKGQNQAEYRPGRVVHLDDHIWTETPAPGVKWVQGDEGNVTRIANGRAYFVSHAAGQYLKMRSVPLSNITDTAPGKGPIAATHGGETYEEGNRAYRARHPIKS